MNENEQYSRRENFMILLLNKIIKEYKALLEYMRRTKPFKIIEVLDISNIPGETKFTIQITNKNCFMSLTAAEILTQGYDLNNFNKFHANMIRQAAQGKLLQFLKIIEKEPKYKIISKKIDKSSEQYIFVIKDTNSLTFVRTAEEISKDKKLLLDMSIDDIYDIAYTQGSESILKEKMALLLLKSQK